MQRLSTAKSQCSLPNFVEITLARPLQQTQQGRTGHSVTFHSKHHSTDNASHHTTSNTPRHATPRHITPHHTTQVPAWWGCSNVCRPGGALLSFCLHAPHSPNLATAVRFVLVLLQEFNPILFLPAWCTYSQHLLSWATLALPHNSCQVMLWWRCRKCET